MTFIVRGTRGADVTTAVRLRADTAVAKARDLAGAGWRVFIDCPDGNRHYPDDFDNLISVSRDAFTVLETRTLVGCRCCNHSGGHVDGDTVHIICGYFYLADMGVRHGR